MKHLHTHRLDGTVALERLRQANQIRKAREALKLSRAAVDRMAGVHPGDTFQLEWGESIPGERRVAILAVLGLTQ